MTDNDTTSPSQAVSNWTRKIKNLVPEISDCQKRVAEGEGKSLVLPGIDLDLWLELLQVDLLEAVVEREMARAKRDAEAPTPGEPGWPKEENEDLERAIDRLRTFLPDLDDYDPPGIDKLTAAELAADEAEHRDLMAGRARFSVEQRRKMQ